MLQYGKEVIQVGPYRSIPMQYNEITMDMSLEALGRLIFCSFAKKLTEKITQFFAKNSIFRQNSLKKSSKTEISANSFYLNLCSLHSKITNSTAKLLGFGWVLAGDARLRKKPLIF